MTGTVRTLLRRFGAQEEGVAAVEFALIFPFLLALYLGSIEGAALFTADKRVNTISSTVGDLIGQWDPDDGNIDTTTTLATYFDAARGIIAPYPTTGVKQVISLVFVDKDGGTKVLWSAQSGGGTIRPVNKPYAPLTSASMTNQVARGGCIVAAETSYSYKPVLGLIFTHAINLAHTNYFIPRYGANTVINLSSTNVSSTACTKGS